MVLSASQQCVIFGYNVLLKSFLSCSIIQTFPNTYVLMYYWQNIILFLVTYVLHEWGCFFNLKRLQTGCFDSQITRVKNKFRVIFLGNPAHTNSNTPSNLYWAKVWCILFEVQSQCPTLKCTSATELKSNSPFLTKMS